MPPSPVSVNTSTKRIVIMNSSRNPRRAWGPGKTPSASTEEMKPEEKKDIISAVVKKYAEAGNADSSYQAKPTDAVKLDEESGKPHSQPNPVKKLNNPKDQNEPKKKPTEENNSSVLQLQNKENQANLQISGSVPGETCNSRVANQKQSSDTQQKDTASPPVQNRTQQFARNSKQSQQNGVSHNQNTDQKNFIPNSSHPKTNYHVVRPQRGCNEECKPPSHTPNKSPPLSGNGNKRQVGHLKYRPPGFPVAPPGFSVAPPGFRYAPSVNFHGARPHFGNDQKGGSPHGNQGSGGSNESAHSRQEKFHEDRRMNVGNKPRGEAKGPNRRNLKKGSQSGHFEMSQKMGQQSNQAPANLVEMRHMNHSSQQSYSVVSPPLYAPASGYIQQVPNSMGHVVQRMPQHVVHPVTTMQPVFVDQEYNVAYYQGPNFVQQPWVGVVTEGQNFAAYAPGPEMIQIQNPPGAPYSVQYMTAPIVPFTSGVPVFAAPVQSQASFTVSSSVGPITASTEAPNHQFPLSQLERSWEGGHPPTQEQNSSLAPATRQENTPTSSPIPASTPIEPSTTSSPAQVSPDISSTPAQAPVDEDQTATVGSPSLVEGQEQQGKPPRPRGAPQKSNMLSVTALERSQRMSSANGKRVPMNERRNKDSPNHMPPAPPDVQEDVIKFICDSWNKVYQEHLKDSSAVAYHVESCPLPEGFVPFDLEAYWGKRLVQNMTTQNIPTQNM